MKPPVAFLAALLGIAPALSAGEREDLDTSLNQLRQIGAALQQHTERNGGRYPKTLNDILATAPEVRGSLLSPLATDGGGPSYELLLPGESILKIANPAKTILVRSRFAAKNGRRPVLFADGHVELVKGAGKN